MAFWILHDMITMWDNHTLPYLLIISRSVPIRLYKKRKRRKKGTF